MKLSISEVRKRLPALVRQVRKGTDASVLITVHDEVVAELRAAQPDPQPGAAARKLMDVMKNLPRHRGKKTSVSTNVKAHLYGGRL